MHKKYIVFINYGAYEGRHIHGEADTWQEAVALREEARINSIYETIICEYIPLLMIDGRSKPDSITD